MSTTTLAFSIPEEQEECRLAQSGGAIASAVTDIDSQLRALAKYGTKAEQRIRVDEVRRLLFKALDDHGVDWVLS